MCEQVLNVDTQTVSLMAINITGNNLWRKKNVHLKRFLYFYKGICLVYLFICVDSSRRNSVRTMRCKRWKALSELEQ